MKIRAFKGGQGFGELPASAGGPKASPLQDCRIQLSSPPPTHRMPSRDMVLRPGLHEIFFFFFEDSAWLDLSYPTKNRNTVQRKSLRSWILWAQEE